MDKARVEREIGKEFEAHAPTYIVTADGKTVQGESAKEAWDRIAAGNRGRRGYVAGEGERYGTSSMYEEDDFSFY